jgi:hypothetical protein
VWRPAEVSWMRGPIRGRAGARALASRQINVRLPCRFRTQLGLEPLSAPVYLQSTQPTPTTNIESARTQTSSIAFATHLISPFIRATNRLNPPASQLADQRRSPVSRNNTPGTYFTAACSPTTNARLSEFPVYTSRTPALSFYPTIRPNNRISTTAHTSPCRLSIYRCV